VIRGNHHDGWVERGGGSHLRPSRPSWKEARAAWRVGQVRLETQGGPSFIVRGTAKSPGLLGSTEWGRAALRRIARPRLWLTSIRMVTAAGYLGIEGSPHASKKFSKTILRARNFRPGKRKLSAWKRQQPPRKSPNAKTAEQREENSQSSVRTCASSPWVLGSDYTAFPAARTA